MSTRTQARKRMIIPPLDVERFELSCGATLLVSKQPGAPVCAMQVHIRGGHSLDPKGKEGTAYLAGSYLTQGTKDFSEEDIANLLEPASGSLSGSSTGMTGHIAGDQWKLLLDVMGSCLTVPTYPKKKIELQKQRLLDRLLMERDDPGSQGAWLFRGLVFGKHWVGRPEYGSLESVPGIERADVLRHPRANWVACRTVIAVSGDLEPKKVRNFLNRRLKDWPTGAPIGELDRNFPALGQRSAIFPAKRQQVHVYLGHLGIERTHPDYAALAVMDHILGTGPGFTARITRKLRDEQGLAYTVHAAIHSSAGILPGTFTAYIGTNPENLATAVRGLQKEIRLIQKELVSNAELALAKNYLTGAYALGFERSARRANAMIAALRNGLPDDYMQQLVDQVAKVTRKDILRVAQEHLHPDRSCLTVAGPVAKKDIVGLMD